MKVVVVYESMFGNCARVAQAIAEGLRDSSLPPQHYPGGAAAEAVTVTVVDVADATNDPALLAGATMVVAGGPTHDLGMSKRRTRATAVDMGNGKVSPRAVGLREWSATLTAPATGTRAAAFETRASKVPLPSSAAKALAKVLRKVGYVVVVPPMAFHVDGAQGPLSEEELARARQWGTQLLTHLPAQNPVTAQESGAE